MAGADSAPFGSVDTAADQNPAQAFPAAVEREPESFDIATVFADGARAVVRTAGALTPAATSLLSSVLHTHLRAGRQCLCVDVGRSPVREPQVVRALADLHRHVAARGGMLVFENAGPLLVDAIRAAAVPVYTAS